MLYEIFHVIHSLPLEAAIGSTLTEVKTTASFQIFTYPIIIIIAPPHATVVHPRSRNSLK